MDMRTTDNIGEDNKTSVKVHHAPGGQSNFNLGWGDNNNVNQNNKKDNFKPNYEYNQHHTTTYSINPTKEDSKEEQNKKDVKTSVKVHAPPGGRSQIQFG